MKILTNDEIEARAKLIADQCLPCTEDFYLGICQGVSLTLKAEQSHYVNQQDKLKYRTPHYSEFVIGFNCEYFEPYSPNQWEPKTFEEDDDFPNKDTTLEFIKNNYRVKISNDTIKKPFIPINEIKDIESHSSPYSSLTADGRCSKLESKVSELINVVNKLVVKHNKFWK